MAVTKIRGNDVSADGASIINLLSQLHAQTVSLSGPVQTRYGTLTLNAAGDLVFTPNQQAVSLGEGMNVSQTINMKVTTDTGLVPIQVTYSVLGVNDAPTAFNDLLVMTNGRGPALNILRNDTDPDARDKLSVFGVTGDNGDGTLLSGGRIQTATKHGTLTITTGGAAKFVVDPRYTKLAFTDTVTYKISDGKGGVSSATFDISNNGGRAAAAPGRLDLISADDSGSSNSDNVTNAHSVTLTGHAQAGQEVTLYSDASSLGTVTADSNGNFTMSGVSLHSGANNITAHTTDPANVELISPTLVITADYEAPNAPVNLALAEVDDTGASTTDGKTSKTSGLTMTGTADPGATVVIYEGSTVLNSGKADANGAFAIDVSLAQGDHALTAKITDLAGNQSTASDERVISVIAPPSVDLKPTISAVASDSGVLQPGAATSDTTPTLTITLGKSLPDGAQVEVLDGTTSLGYASGSGTDFSFTPSTGLSEGSHAFTARVVDVAGSKGPVSVVRSVAIDTTAPGAAGKLDLATADDTGRSSTDNVTSHDTALTLTGTVASGTLASDVTLYEWSDADGNGAIDAGELSVITPDSAAVSGTTFKADVSLDDGSHALLITQKDKAGNESVTSVDNLLNVVVDTQAPDAPAALALAADDDSGLNSDAVTSHKSALTISGTAEALSQVELYRVSGSSQVSLGKVVAAADGSFSLDISLAEGVTDVYARSTDVAGNTSVASAPLHVTIDSTAPTAPSITALATASDSGASHSDRITNLTSGLTLSGSAEAGASVELFTSADGHQVSLGTTTADNSGLYSLDVSLSEGVNLVTAQATDLAGNVSAASSAFKVTVDTTAPTEVTSLNLLDSDDTGASHTDNITSMTSGLTLSAAVVSGTAPAAVTFYEWTDSNQNGVVDGGDVTVAVPALQVTAAAVNGTSYVANLSLSDGVHVLLATQKDLAGNESALDAANAFTITVDSSAPTQTTGLNNASQVDNDTVQVTGKLSGALADGETIQVFDNSSGAAVLLGQATVAADHLSWSFRIDADSAVKSLLVSANVLDVAGNAGPSSPQLSLILGTTGDDTISGTTGNDIIFGFAGADRITGGDGNDSIYGGDGNDIIDGENGNDTVHGGNGNDNLRGGAGNDTLYGDAGQDTLEGGVGDDLLVGGAGADTMTGDVYGTGNVNGSAGHDIFRVLAGDSGLPPSGTATADVASIADAITDFAKASDTIDLGSLQVDLTDTSSDSSYSNAMTSAGNELKTAGDSSYQYVDETSGGGLLAQPTHTYNGYLFINADGVPGADQVIQLVGLAADANVG